MYKNGIWKPQEPYDYFPQAQKVYIETVVKKKAAKSDAFKIKNSLQWGWLYFSNT